MYTYRIVIDLKENKHHLKTEFRDQQCLVMVVLRHLDVDTDCADSHLSGERVGVFVHVSVIIGLWKAGDTDEIAGKERRLCTLFSTMLFSLYAPSLMQMAKPILPCFRRPNRPRKAKVSSRYEEAETERQQRILVIEQIQSRE